MAENRGQSRRASNGGSVYSDIKIGTHPASITCASIITNLNHERKLNHERNHDSENSPRITCAGRGLTSPASRLNLARISLESRSHLTYISLASRLHLARTSGMRGVHGANPPQIGQ